MAPTFKISFFGLIITLTAFLIGFSTSFWVHISSKYHVGLWVATGAHASAALKGVQAMECFALIFGFACIILLSLYTRVESFTNNASAFLIAKIAAIVAGALALIGVIIYGSKLGRVDILGWSLWVCGISGVFFLIFGGILFVKH